tara:strand:+ start:33088 stop:34002 length:915 start_codon:yes stop_codon:yes gene_type:complete
MEITVNNIIKLGGMSAAVSTSMGMNKKNENTKHAEHLNDAIVRKIVEEAVCKKNPPDEFSVSLQINSEQPYVTNVDCSYKEINIDAILEAINGSKENHCHCPVCEQDGSVISVFGQVSRLAKEKLAERVDDLDNIKSVCTSIVKNALSLEKSTYLFMDEPDVLEELKLNYLPSSDSISALSAVSRDLIINMAALRRLRREKKAEYAGIEFEIIEGVVCLHELYRLDKEVFWSVFHEVDKSYADRSDSEKNQIMRFLSFTLRGLTEHLPGLRNPFKDGHLGDADVEFSGSKAVNFIFHPHLKQHK